MAGCAHPEDRARRLFGARDYVSGERFEVVRCERCGLAWTAPRFESARVATYYPPAYYGDSRQRRFPAAVEAAQRLLYRPRARAVERLAGGPGRVLDVGCGRGHLLDAFRRRGWEVQGTELDERSSAYAREVLKVPVRVGAAAAWDWPDESFDAVTLWHVLEHLADPADAIARAARLLRPGGVLLVGVPNFESPEASLAREGWFHLDVPRHLWHLSPRWLDQALSASGLEPRRWSFAAPEFDCFSLTQSVENRLGLRPNLLYELLRGRSAKLLGERPARPVETLAALLLAAPLGAVALPITALLALARRGSSVTVLAVRRARST